MISLKFYCIKLIYHNNIPHNLPKSLFKENSELKRVLSEHIYSRLIVYGRGIYNFPLEDIFIKFTHFSEFVRVLMIFKFDGYIFKNSEFEIPTIYPYDLLRGIFHRDKLEKNNYKLIKKFKLMKKHDASNIANIGELIKKIIYYYDLGLYKMRITN